MKYIFYILLSVILPLSALAAQPAKQPSAISASKQSSVSDKDSSATRSDSAQTNAAEGAVSSVKSKADKAYAAQQYEEAARLYLLLTREGDNADVCYNLGNCYYRMDDVAHAILWYERALLLNPGDEDIRANLQFARTKTVDKIVPEEDIFFVSWYHSLLNTMSVSGWVWTGIILFALALIGLSLYFFGGQLIVRKVGFFSSVVLVLLVILSNVFAYQQRQRQKHRDRAVVMEESVVVKSAPNDTSRDLFLLHTGTSMQLLDSTMKDWYQIRLSDGKEGWIPAHALEVI